MDIRLKTNDIYDVRIGDTQIGTDMLSGCPSGYDDFDVDVDDVDSDDDIITIEISGTCLSHGHHSPIKCEFEGELTMDADDFEYDYTTAAKYGDKYVRFYGNIIITMNTSNITVNDDVIDKTFSDTINNIEKLFEDRVEDPSSVIDDLIRHVIPYMDADIIIKTIKEIDAVETEIYKDNLYGYLESSILDTYTGEFNDKYTKLEPVFFSEFKRLINNRTVGNELNFALEDCASDCSDYYDISAAVFLSSLDP